MFTKFRCKARCAQICGLSFALLNAWCVSQTSGQNTTCPPDMRVSSSVFKKASSKFWWLWNVVLQADGFLSFSACIFFFFFKEKKNKKQMQETWENFCSVSMTMGDSSALLESDNKIGSDRGILLKLPFLWSFSLLCLFQLNEGTGLRIHIRFSFSFSFVFSFRGGKGSSILGHKKSTPKPQRSDSALLLMWIKKKTYTDINKASSVSVRKRTMCLMCVIAEFRAFPCFP